MFTLIVWAHFAGGTVISLQQVPAVACGALREAAARVPDVDHAMCAGNPLTPIKYLQAGQCYLAEYREEFSNYICTNGAAWR